MDIISLEEFGVARAMGVFGAIMMLFKYVIIVYVSILFVKLSNRAIKLMDIIIDEKNKSKE